ncbi:MAG: hypothetical protein DRP47_11870 [Candidatus Zixiibacteriota bacterium]|nr:MAG: hypothetical protein DRP47_11870 [candidate division Zixibacteria bacterium]
MKTSQLLSTTCYISLALLFLLTTSPASAEDYSTYASFSANDTSTVAPGDSQDFTLFDDFWGLRWHKKWSTGSNRLADGNPDNDPNNDYRFSIDTYGRMGFDAYAGINLGSLDINSPLYVNMRTAQANNITTIDTDYSILHAANFSTSGITGGIDLDFIGSAYLRAIAVAAVAGHTFDALGGTLIDRAFHKPLIDIHEGQILYHKSYLDGLVDVTAKIPDVIASGTNTAATGLTGEVSRAQRTASSSISDSFLNISANANEAFKLATGVPLGAHLDVYNDFANFGVDVRFDFLNAAIGAEAKLAQDFSVTMNPGIHLEFDRPVLVQDEMGWTSRTHYDTTLGNTINISSVSGAHATTTYTMDWQVSNDISIDVDAYLDLTAGYFNGRFGYVFDDHPLGPFTLYQDRFETPALGISLYDEDWLVQGQDVAGESFALTSIPNLGGMLSDFTDNVTPDNIAARNALGTTIINRGTTPTGDETPNLFTENPDLYGFLAGYTDADGTHIDVLEGSARWDLYNLLASYDSNSADADFNPANSVFSGYFDFILDDSIDLGIDFQPMFADSDSDGNSSNDPIIGLFANFYGLTTCPSNATSCTPSTTLLSDLGLDQLFGTSFAFFYNDLAGMTDLTIYQNSAEDRGSFIYAYSAMEQYSDPVPEPATILLLVIGLFGLIWYKRKKKQV